MRGITSVVGRIARDRVAQAGVVVFLLAAGARVLSSRGDLDLGVQLESLTDPLLLLVAVLATTWGRSRLGARERDFWNLLAVAWGCLLLVEAFLLFDPRLPLVSASFLADTLHILFYLILALALDLRPHALGPDSMSTAVRRIESIAGSLVVFGFLIYFGLVVLPEPLGLSLSFVSREQGFTPLLLVRLSLDLFILGRFLYAWLRVEGRWYWIYLWFTWSMLFFAVKDAVAITEFEGILVSETLGLSYEVFLGLPVLIVILNARYAHLTVVEESDENGDKEAVGGEAHAGPLLLYLLAVPATHFLMYPLGLLEPASRAPRELFCLGYLVVLGTLAWVHQSKVARDAARAHEALRGAQDRLRESERLEAIGRLAGGIAHDFNNYLTVIQGYGELVHADVDDPEIRSNVALIQEAADSAAAITRQLLAFGRRQLLRPQPLDLNEVVNRTSTMLRRLIGEDVELVLDLDPHLAPTAADLAQTEQVIINLALNSRDAMPDGGRLEIRTRAVEVGGAEAKSAGVDPGAFAELTVSDSGAGMSEEVRTQIFEPFFTTKSLGRGTGLGLATVYGIISQSDGAIEVDSDLGRGTSVRVLLPIAEGEAIRESSRGHRLREIGGEATILLVEDENTVRNFAEQALTASGFRVLAAPGGEEALDLASRYEGDIDVLVTDVMMPGIDGLQLAARLTSRHRGLRVLFVSGYPLETLRERHAELPLSTPFLHKPFNASSLVRGVNSALGSQ